jgi:tight adherence protein B
VAGLIALVAVPLLVRMGIRIKTARRRRQFADQLADQLQSVAAAMRAGHSFAGALSALLEDAPEPSATEFGRVVADERLGVPLEEALGEAIVRTGNRDLQQVALVASLQRETGGNGAEALDRVVDNIRGRDDVRRLVETLTSQGKLSRWILTLIPVGLGLALMAMGGGYMDPMLHSGIGLFMLIVACVMVTMGSQAIKKIVDIRV